MGLALAFTALVAVYAFLEGSPKRATAKPAVKAAESESLVRSDPGVDPRKELTVSLAEVKPPDTKPEKEPEPKPGPDVAEPRPKPRPDRTTDPEPQPESDPDPLPLAEADWPSPTEEQIEAANRNRQYELPRGAMMGLTVPSIGLRDAPVLRSDARNALDKGVVHASGTSMPWSETPERNVYLAGHRLGWPDTGSHLIFYRLDELSEGDEVVLKNREGKRYGYKVIDTFVVEPNESWVTGRIRGRDMVTLQTCVGRDFSKRLIVRADRVL